MSDVNVPGPDPIPVPPQTAPEISPAVPTGGFVLGDKVYKVLKALALVWLPAAGTLYFTLAAIWHLPAAEQVVGTILAIDTFLGVGLKISTKSYNASDAGFDGVIHVVPGEGGDLLGVKIDPTAVANKDSISLKVVNAASAPGA